MIANSSHATYDSPKILVVEDHDDTRDMLRELLEVWGCQVVEACDGIEAVQAAIRERPALILMDGSLPLLDGLGATRRIRENSLLKQAKIVALNGWGSASFNAAALSAGCDDSLIKPLDFERLQRHIAPLFAASSRVTPGAATVTEDRCGGAEYTHQRRKLVSSYPRSRSNSSFTTR